MGRKIFFIGGKMKFTNKLFASFLIACLIYANIAHADKVGNGGNVIVCDSGSVELLDYFELRLNGGVLNFDTSLPTYQERLQDLFTRWQSVGPIRISQYQKWLNEFQSEVGIYPNVTIPDIPDTGTVLIPVGCHMEPVAFQRSESDVLPGAPRYVINKNLWDKMDENQKAGLVLHELIYRESLDANFSTSIQTRYLNGYFASQAPEVNSYTYTIYSLPFNWVEYYGLTIDVSAGMHVYPPNKDHPLDSYYSYVHMTPAGLDWLLLKKKFSGELRCNSPEFSFSIPHINDSRVNTKIYYEKSANFFYLSADFSPIAWVEQKGIYHIEFLENNGSWYYKDDYKIYGNREGYGPKTNPANSWLMTKDGKKIDHITTYDETGIHTSTGEIWIWDDSKKTYVLK
jgi:hypothetical protein